MASGSREAVVLNDVFRFVILEDKDLIDVRAVPFDLQDADWVLLVRLTIVSSGRIRLHVGAIVTLLG